MRHYLKFMCFCLHVLCRWTDICRCRKIPSSKIHISRQRIIFFLTWSNVHRLNRTRYTYTLHTHTPYSTVNILFWIFVLRTEVRRMFPSCANDLKEYCIDFILSKNDKNKIREIFTWSVNIRLMLICISGGAILYWNVAQFAQVHCHEQWTANSEQSHRIETFHFWLLILVHLQTEIVWLANKLKKKNKWNFDAKELVHHYLLIVIQT